MRRDMAESNCPNKEAEPQVESDCGDSDILRSQGI